MNKLFIPKMGPGSGSGSRFFRAQLTPDGGGGGNGATQEELKELAKIRMKNAANEAIKEQLPELLKSGLTGDDAAGVIKQIVTDALAGMTIMDDVDQTAKTFKEIFGEFQKQHNDLAKLVKDGGMVASKQTGIYVDFVKKNIEGFKGAEFPTKGYSSTATFKAADLMSTANITGAPAVGGFSPLFGNFIDTEIGHVPKPENIILSLITVRNQPGTENIYYSDRVNEEGDAKFIGEGTLKPLASAKWLTSKEPVKEVAVRWKFTNRLMFHAPSVVQDFLEHVVTLIDTKVDDAALAGTGVGDELMGISTVAAAFVVPPQLANYYERANIYDAIMAMATRIRLSNFKGQLTVVLNTVWRAKMKGIKDLNGNYVIPPFVTQDGTNVDGVNVVFSNKVDDAKILLGDLRHFNLVWAETVRYDEGYEMDDFSKNLVSRKLEAYLGTYIKKSSAGAILMDDIATVLTAIEKVAE